MKKPARLKGPSSPECLRLKERREREQQLWLSSPSSEELKPALEQTRSQLECRSELSRSV